MHHSLQNPTCQKEIPKAPELSQASRASLMSCYCNKNYSFCPHATRESFLQNCSPHQLQIKLFFMVMAQFYPCQIFKRDIILLTFHAKKCYLNSINQIYSCSWPVSYEWKWLRIKSNPMILSDFLKQYLSLGKLSVYCIYVYYPWYVLYVLSTQCAKLERVNLHVK